MEVVEGLTSLYPRSIALTWEMSIDQLAAAGRDLLNVLAWLAPEPIPAHVFRPRSGPGTLVRSPTGR